MFFTLENMRLVLPHQPYYNFPHNCFHLIAQSKKRKLNRNPLNSLKSLKLL